MNAVYFPTFALMEETSRPLTISILGCGWLGLPLLRSLTKAGHQLRGSSRSPETLLAIKAAGGVPFQIDLPGEVPKAFYREAQVLIITLPPGGRSLGPSATEVYLQKLASIAPIMEMPAAPHVIYTSSTGVYGEETGRVDELSPLRPSTHSGRAVLAAEKWLLSYPAVTILRLAGLIAEDRHPGRFYGGRDRPIPNADAPVNLIHREDVISAVHLVLKKALPKGIFNVCAASHPPKGKFYSAAAASINLPILGCKDGGSGGKVISSRKLRKLGWAPRHDKLM